MKKRELPPGAAPTKSIGSPRRGRTGAASSRLGGRLGASKQPLATHAVSCDTRRSGELLVYGGDRAGRGWAADAAPGERVRLAEPQYSTSATPLSSIQPRLWACPAPDRRYVAAVPAAIDPAFGRVEKSSQPAPSRVIQTQT